LIQFGPPVTGNSTESIIAGIELVTHLCIDFVQRLQDELHKAALASTCWSLLPENPLICTQQQHCQMPSMCTWKYARQRLSSAPEPLMCFCAIPEFYLQGCTITRVK